MAEVQLVNNGKDKPELNAHAKPDKIAMSKALGQAFLSHQVRRLEEDAGGRGRHSNRRGSSRAHPDMNNKSHNTVTRRNIVNAPRSEEMKQPIPNSPNRIVLDASVLVHALDQVKKWCSVDSETKIVIPLEVLSTLDLLKKGNSSISVYARAASRLLEEQVGANTRITLQEDAAVADWPSQTEAGIETPEPPQWLANTLRCVLWEQSHSPNSIVLAVMDDMIPSSEPATKFDQRAEGSQVREWAKLMGIPLFSLSQRSKPEIYKSDDRRTTRPRNDAHHPQNRRGRGSRSGLAGGPLVEKPAAPTPSVGVRLLARGEMLAP